MSKGKSPFGELAGIRGEVIIQPPAQLAGIADELFTEAGAEHPLPAWKQGLQESITNALRTTGTDKSTLPQVDTNPMDNLLFFNSAVIHRRHMALFGRKSSI